MSWEIDGSQPIDKNLRDKIFDRIDESLFSKDDFHDYFTVFTQICNHTEDIQDEVEGITRLFLIKINDKPFAWLSIKDQKFVITDESRGNADMVISMNDGLAVQIFSGKIDPTAAYLNGDLKVDGLINDAILFRTLLEMVQEELE